MKKSEWQPVYKRLLPFIEAVLSKGYYHELSEFCHLDVAADVAHEFERLTAALPSQ